MEGVRLEILCGMRAYEYVNRLMEQNRKNSALLSAKPTETNAAAERMAEELAGAKYRVSQLENELFALKAKAYAGMADVLLFESAMSPDAVRRFADAILAGCTGRIAIFAGDDETGYKYALCKKDGDLRETVKALNAACNGRGGRQAVFRAGQRQRLPRGDRSIFPGKGRMRCCRICIRISTTTKWPGRPPRRTIMPLFSRPTARSIAISQTGR